MGVFASNLGVFLIYLGTFVIYLGEILAFLGTFLAFLGEKVIYLGVFLGDLGENFGRMGVFVSAGGDARRFRKIENINTMEKLVKQKFTAERIKASYSAAKKYFDGKIDRQEGIRQMMAYGINPGSARIILDGVIFQMMTGEEFTRTLSVAAFEYYLKMIKKDYGIERLSVVLNALEKHIKYIAEKKDPKKKLRQVYEIYRKALDVDSSISRAIDQKKDEIEQEEIANSLKDMSRSQAIEEAQRITPTEPEIVIINHKAYKRENKNIVIIKKARGFACQICGTSIRKADGKFYIEAAHITPKHEKGTEVPENIIILCPNHHKEFDLGDKQNVVRSTDSISFTLNGNYCSINLKLN